MKTAMTMAAVMVALLVPADASKAQWSGVAAIAASQGYSASPAMGMAAPLPAVPDVAPAAEDRSNAPAAPRLRVPRTALADLAAGRQHRHRVHLARIVAHRRPAMVARAKRPLSRRHARIA